MIDRKELIRWLNTLTGDVAVDDGGLTLVELDEFNKPTGAYHEVGGIPLDEDEEE